MLMTLTYPPCLRDLANYLVLTYLHETLLTFMRPYLLSWVLTYLHETFLNFMRPYWPSWDLTYLHEPYSRGWGDSSDRSTGFTAQTVHPFPLILWTCSRRNILEGSAPSFEDKCSHNGRLIWPASRGAIYKHGDCERIKSANWLKVHQSSELRYRNAADLSIDDRRLYIDESSVITAAAAFL